MLGPDRWFTGGRDGSGAGTRGKFNLSSSRGGLLDAPDDGCGGGCAVLRDVRRREKAPRASDTLRAQAASYRSSSAKDAVSEARACKASSRALQKANQFQSQSKLLAEQRKYKYVPFSLLRACFGV